MKPEILEDTNLDLSLEDSHEAELPAGSEISESPQDRRMTMGSQSQKWLYLLPHKRLLDIIPQCMNDIWWTDIS